MANYVKMQFKKHDIRLKDIPKFYQGLSERKITVGVHKEQGKHNVEKAFWNEFGFSHVLSKNVRKRLANGHYVTLKAGTLIVTPARPFIRLYLYPEKMQKLSKEIQYAFNLAIMSGLHAPKTESEKMLKNVAYKSEWIMKEGIISNNDLIPNAPLTVEIKGFDYPLFKTGNLLNSIRGKVTKI